MIPVEPYFLIAMFTVINCIIAVVHMWSQTRFLKRIAKTIPQNTPQTISSATPQPMPTPAPTMEQIMEKIQTGQKLNSEEIAIFTKQSGKGAEKKKDKMDKKVQEKAEKVAVEKGNVEKENSELTEAVEWMLGKSS